MTKKWATTFERLQEDWAQSEERIENIKSADEGEQFVAELLRKEARQALGKGEDLEAFGRDCAEWLRSKFFEGLPSQPEDSPERSALQHPCCYRSFLISLQGEEESYRARMIGDLFHGKDEELKNCISNYLAKNLSAYFKRIVDDFHQWNAKQGMDMDESISRFVDDGLFKSSLEYFQESEGLDCLDEELCAKIFYKSFQKHFDTRHGMGVTEMIEVGQKHPKVLEKMRLMQEYEDIRASLLRLQLIGEIDSKNYR